MIGLWFAAAILLPLFSVALIHLSGRRDALRLAAWSALPALLVSLFAPAENIDVPWLLIGARLGLDETGRVFLFLTALLWLSAGLFAVRFLAHEEERLKEFFTYFLLAMTGNLGLTMAQDMLSFYLFFALMSFASYGLIVYHRDASALHAGRVYILLVVLGEAIFFAGLALAAFSAGAIDYFGLKSQAAQWGQSQLIVGLLAIGLSVKVGALPLHVWLPLAHPAAPAPASAVLSGAMIKAGLLGWIRFLPLGALPVESWALVAVVAGLTAAYFGALVGIVQKNAKTVLAYSSISQMGIITIALGVALGEPDAWPVALTAILIYALHHALAKAALFLGVGVAHFGSSARWQRVLILLGLLFPALALAGAPLTSGAIAKTALKHATSEASDWAESLPLLLSLAAVGTTLLMGRTLYLARPHTAKPGVHLPAGLWLPWLMLLVPLVLFVLLLPQFALPLPKADYLLSPQSIWGFLWPLLIGILLIAMAWCWGPGISFPAWLLVPAGDLLSLLLWLLEQIGRDFPSFEFVRPLRTHTDAFNRRQQIRHAALRNWLGHVETLLTNWLTLGVCYVVLAVLLAALLTQRYAH